MIVVKILIFFILSMTFLITLNMKLKASYSEIQQTVFFEKIPPIFITTSQ